MSTGKMTSAEKDEAIADLANQVQAMHDELLLANVYLSALTEMVCESSVNGRPITQETLEKRRIAIGESMQKEWERMQQDAEAAANVPVEEGVQ